MSNEPLKVHPGGGEAEPGRLGICLCGGGLVGAFYEIGALKALDEFLGPGSVRGLFDIWVGTSAGATVAGILSQGISPDRLFQAAWNPSDPFFPLQRTDVFRLNGRRWARVGLDLLWQVAKGTLFDFFRMPGTPTTDLARELERQLPAGIFSLEHYRKIYEETLRRNGLSNSFFELGRELVIPATDLDTGRRVVFAKGSPLETTPICCAVAASSAIPGFFEPVRVGTQSFIDGGTGQVAHIDLAFERGARSILVINPIVPVQLTRPHQTIMASTEQIDSISSRGLFKVWSQSFRIGTSARVKMGLKRFVAEHPDVKVILIEPPLDDATMFLYSVMDEQARHRILQHGYRSTLQALERQGETFRDLARPARAKWLRAVGGPGALAEPGGEFYELGAGGEDSSVAGTGW